MMPLEVKTIRNRKSFNVATIWPKGGARTFATEGLELPIEGSHSKKCSFRTSFCQTFQKERKISSDGA